MDGRDVVSYAVLRSAAGPLVPSISAPGPELCASESSQNALPVQRIKCSWEPPEQPPAEPTPPGPTTPSTSEPPPAPPSPPQPVDAGFRYYPPGDLLSQDEKRGRAERKVYAPNMIFPLRLGPGQHAHMNSQIWGYGGGGYNGKGEAGGSECDPRNYDPKTQRDNFCEVRGWSMPLCPSGVGHQGQDIRPPSCKDNTWEAVAVEDGTITYVSSNTTVRLKAKDGTVYEYLHMHPASIAVKQGQSVKQGDVLGRVSKYMNGTRSTTYHLHFNVRQLIKVGTKVLDVYVPPFPSLIAAYRQAKGLGPSVDADGNLIVDARYEIGAVAQQPTPPPAPAPSPEPTPAPQPAPAPAPAPEPAPAPQPTPAPEPAPAPAPAPEPQPTPAPEPAPQPAPAPEPAPQPQPAPAPAPEPAPQPAPQPEPSKSWWQWSVDKAVEYWRWLWK